MSEETQSELETLRQRADLMGIEYHPNLGVKKLRTLVNARLDADHAETVAEVEAEPEEVPEAPVVAEKEAAPVKKSSTKKAHTPRAETPAELKKRIAKQKEIRILKAKELVRVRVTCMNPNKADWNGEIFTVQNRSVGTLRKYVPFNAPDGWHIPRMMLNMLKNKQCQTFHTVNQGGVKVRKGRLIPEFAIEELPPLTQKELDQIATRQAAQGTMET